MEMVDLAYTPHPNERREAPIVIRGVAPQAAGSANGASGGLAAMAVASMAVLSSVALLGAPRDSAPVYAADDSRPAAATVFAARETKAEAAAAVRPAAVPAPVETRAESPLPVAAGVLGPVPEPAPAPAPAVAAREQHTLVGFDGVTTMTDGPATQGAPAPQYARNDLPEAPAARPSFPPPPVVWNNPIQWIKVHPDGL